MGFKFNPLTGQFDISASAASSGMDTDFSNAEPSTVDLDLNSNNLINIAEILVNKTITPSGTTGDVVINKISGTVNVAIGETTVGVVNNLVNEDSIVFAVIRTTTFDNVIASVVPSAGRIDINLSGGAAAVELSIGFLVIN